MPPVADAVTLPFYPALVLLAALWGGSFLFMRVAAPELGPVWLIALRVLIAGLALLPLVILRRQTAVLRAHWRMLLLVGFLSAGAPFTLLAYASIHLTAGTTSILNATVPIFAAVVGAVWFEEPLHRRRLLGVALGFCGVVVLVGSPGDAASAPLLPVAAGLLAALMYVLAANLAKRRLAGVPAEVSVTGSQLGAGLLLLPLLPGFVPAAVPDGIVIASVLALALLSTALAFVVYFRLLHEHGPMRTLTVTYLIPVFAIAWGALLLGEPLTPGMLVGGLLTLLGVALANRRVGAFAAVRSNKAGRSGD